MKRRVLQAAAQSWQTHLQWLTPGIGVKRWLIILALGVGLLSLGGAVALRASYPLPQYFYYLTLQFLPPLLRAGLILVLGLGILSFGIWGLNRAILEPFTIGNHAPIPTVLHDYRRRGRGPEVVAIGGGHGQATVLRGLKSFTSNLTAVVTVADDGGSSGRLRRDIGILPPGDFRNCIAALADDESLVTRLFQYRYAQGRDLSGHSFGNLFITAMAGITGSFEAALRESSQVLAVQGRVLPSTLEAVALCADISQDGGTAIRVCGESEIPAARGQILRVTLEPNTPRAFPGVIQAVLSAKMVVIGPGSLFTSILPNLLVPQILEALKATAAHKVYICNVLTQPGETDRCSARDHFEALERHIGQNVIDTVIINDHVPAGLPLVGGSDWVVPDLDEIDHPHVIRANLVDEVAVGHHDSKKLAELLLELIER